MSTLAYEIVDVFTDRPFAGNPLAVVFGAEALATEQMQALALEFNLSETVFVLPPTQVGATYRARIFTPVEELPFAGHPSVGAAVTASRRGMFGVGQVTQECEAGVLPIEVTASGATLTGGTPTLGPELDPEPLLEIAGLVADDHIGPAPRVAGCGLEFPYLPVRPESVARARVDAAAAQRYGVSHVSVFSWDAAAQTAHARVFVPGIGVSGGPGDRLGGARPRCLAGGERSAARRGAVGVRGPSGRGDEPSVRVGLHGHRGERGGGRRDRRRPGGAGGPR